ncbi:MAG TPA: nucleotidyltransferase family protein [Actinomycetota bacterium]|nr:nucleotidyltransferase family protein [Actinomycetota bacterium]
MAEAGPDLLAAVATFGLGSDLEGLPTPPEGEWRRTLGRLTFQRLTGLAVAAAQAGALQLAPERWVELLRAHREAMAHCLTLERTLLEVTAALEGEGVAGVVLKGPALAHTAYPDPSWRPFGDLDLLVPVSQWETACATLRGLGFLRVYPEPRPGFVVRFGHTALHRNPEGVELDLHRTLIAGPFGQWIDPGDLFRGTVPFTLGGHTLRRLGDTARFLHACVHAALGFAPPLLLPLRDVAQTAHAGSVDWELAASLARKWRIAAVVGFALRAVRETLGVPPPAGAQALMDLPVERRQRRALSACVGPRRFRGGPAVETLRAIPSLRLKAAYLRALLLPSREFLAARVPWGRRPGYLTRWRTPLRWLRRAVDRA